MLSHALHTLALAGLVAAGTPGASERWTATSTAAIAITGDVTVRADRLVFSTGASLPIRMVRKLSYTDDAGVTGPATLFRVLKPADPVLLHGNRVCGGSPGASIAYLVAWRSAPIVPGERPGRAFAAYSGRTEPAPNAKAACAVLRYEVAK